MPSGPPQDVIIDFVSEITIQLSWSLPSKDHQNGVITGFELCLRPLSLAARCLYHTNTSADETWMLFVDLQPFKEYTISVKASTVLGYGPAANITQMTLTAGTVGVKITSFNNAKSSLK